MLQAGRLATDLEFRPKNAAPAVPAEIESAFDLEVLKQVLELIDEEVDRPERRLLLLPCRPETLVIES